MIHGQLQQGLHESYCLELEAEAEVHPEFMEVLSRILIVDLEEGVILSLQFALQ
jgi:hypothetical protein